MRACWVSSDQVAIWITFLDDALPRTQISPADAIVDARKVPPNSGSGYEVLKTELESTSTHFNSAVLNFFPRLSDLELQRP
jgi:hypothetical protein